MLSDYVLMGSAVRGVPIQKQEISFENLVVSEPVKIFPGLV
jgi:hypothetical protein